jgi:hypothetical protein
MNDKKSFGERFHTLSFGEAIERDLLTDYRVLIIGVDDERIKESIENRLLVATDTGLTTDARSLAAQIGSLKAIKDWDLQRLISFHGRVKRAKEFAEDIIQVCEWLDGDHSPSKNLWAEYVSGEMPAIVRRQKLKRLANVGKGEIGLLSNARCLSEGIDVPTLDGVVFIDPRSSEIDIIQSVGRAIRLSENKTMGTIVLPVFIEQTCNAEEALAASDFKPIWDVLEALKSHDNRLSDELDQLRIDLGAKRKQSVGGGDLRKIIFDLPTSVTEEFAQSLRTYLVTETTESWMFWYGLLEEFVKEYGHCRVERKYQTPDGYRLGQWAGVQRRNRDTISAERKGRLNALGFDWHPHDTGWQEGLDYLRVYKDQYGHCSVPALFKTANGYRLGQWVSIQRLSKKTLSKERISQLDNLGFDWGPHDAAWKEGFENLRSFANEFQHCNVPVEYRLMNGYKLGFVVRNWRHRKASLSPEQIESLDKLGFDWSPLTTQWEEGFKHLQEFVRNNKHCRVPQSYKSADGYRLGGWVVEQRHKDTLPDSLKKRLDAVGFDWDPHKTKWEEGFKHLQEFVRTNKHCRVPYHYKSPDGYGLWVWLGTQRQRRDSLSPEQIDHLDTFGFDWDPHKTKWEKGFKHLQEFVKDNKHCRVPGNYKSPDGYLLGRWVQHQRSP